jgi:hypothetical protein
VASLRSSVLVDAVFASGAGLWSPEHGSSLEIKKKEVTDQDQV